MISAALLSPGIAAADDILGAAPAYASVAGWVCRPGAESVCTTGLDAKVVDRDDAARVVPFAPAIDPPIDCFYVYPTVSRESTPYSDARVTPEIASIVNAQAGRFTSKCRVFAPVYRQATLAHLSAKLAGEPVADSDAPERDVAAAWAYYLAHDNRGRGVVLIGHSQGTILLQQLIAASIDATPARALLVSAFLAGDPSLGVPPRANVGGTFAHIPTCASASQIGCAYAWGSYLESDAATRRVFGRARRDDLISACVDPAAPSGGTGTLKFFHRKPAGAPASDPPWVETVDRLSGTCRADSLGNALRVAVEPGPLSSYDAAFLDRLSSPDGWGLHPLDIALVQGNMLDVLDAETAAWVRLHVSR